MTKTELIEFKATAIAAIQNIKLKDVNKFYTADNLLIIDNDEYQLSLGFK